MPTERLALRWPSWVLAVALLAFLMGAMIPGSLRSAIEYRLHLPFAISPVAHFVLSAGMATGLRALHPRWPVILVLAVVIGIGCLAEVVQAWIPGRDASFVDLAADLGGAVLGLCVVALAMRLCNIIRP
ncbi:VanZ family protein [Halomonas salinarum]|uniref:VanZ family protein n=1 Tax=Halomonas salinarum TaxID=1158993 RepID=UPI003CC90D0F